MPETPQLTPDDPHQLDGVVLERSQEARDLITAYPETEFYLDRLTDEDAAPLVVKIGGGEVDDQELANQLDYLSRLGVSIIVIHGAGPQTSIALKAAGIEKQEVEGMRVTTREAMPIVQGTQEGVNKGLVDLIGPRSISITNALISSIKGADLGLVGNPEQLKKDRIDMALKAGKIVVMNSVGYVPANADQDGYSGPTNNNADQVAALVANEYRAKEVVMVTGTGAVLKNDEATGGEARPISVLYPVEAEALMKSGEIDGGMMVKVRAALDILASGDEELRGVAIIKGRDIFKELFEHFGMGTLVTERPRFEKIDRQKITAPLIREVTGIINEAFGDRRLIDGFWDKILDEKSGDFSHILLGQQDYGAVGVVRTPDALKLANGVQVQLLDKIAAKWHYEGTGVSSSIIEQARQEGPVMWRARIAPDDVQNVLLRERIYPKLANYSQIITDNNGTGWVVYSVGLEGDSMTDKRNKMMQFVANESGTIVPKLSKAKIDKPW